MDWIGFLISVGIVAVSAAAIIFVPPLKHAFLDMWDRLVSGPKKPEVERNYLAEAVEEKRKWNRQLMLEWDDTFWKLRQALGEDVRRTHSGKWYAGSGRPPVPVERRTESSEDTHTVRDGRGTVYRLDTSGFRELVKAEDVWDETTSQWLHMRTFSDGTNEVRVLPSYGPRGEDGPKGEDAVTVRNDAGDTWQVGVGKTLHQNELPPSPF